MNQALKSAAPSLADPGPVTGPVLEVNDLVVEAGPASAPIRLVDGVSFSVQPGEAVALVGESGSGKSMASLATMGLLPAGARVASGSIRLDGEELRSAGSARMRKLRGSKLSMVFQDPMTSLNPLQRIGPQLAEMLRLHRTGLSRAEIHGMCIEMLAAVRLPDPEAKLKAFPHQLSGGQRQRVMIAMATANNPRMLIADEPTTALDVTVQAEVLRILREVRAQSASSLLLITHDLGVVAQNADRVLVMRHGKLLEEGTAEQIFHDPKDPYTRQLLDAVRILDRPRPAQTAPKILLPVHPAPTNEEAVSALSLVDLRVEYPRRSGWGRKAEPYKAVDGVTLHLPPGRTLGLVGESGCGKSTLVKCILGMQTPTGGHVSYLGHNLTKMTTAQRRPYRSVIQAVFQDPFSSLDPRLSAHEIIAEPLRINRCYSPDKVHTLMDQVGLSRESGSRKPIDFSGGQRQRIGIARALALRPRVLVLDEPTSALDVSIQAQVLALLEELQRELGLTYLFVSHDLGVVRAVADEVAVMRSGRIVEYGPASKVLGAPGHAYTAQLLAAVPHPDPRRRTITPAA